MNMNNKLCIVFDVNETLLDLGTMRPIFERIFKDPGAVRLWFQTLIVYSESLTLANVYVPFTDIGAAVLEMFAKTRGITVSADDKRELTDRFATMPAHPEVPSALRMLRGAGFRLFTLTDNLLEIQTRQLEHAGIVNQFERRFSVDQEVKRHKPAPEAYGYVEQQLGIGPANLMLIACHTWDTIGALGAGWHAAFIKRPDNERLAVGPQVEIDGKDLHEVATQIISRYGGSM
jgi:2-haloacid dehalogenase